MRQLILLLVLLVFAGCAGSNDGVAPVSLTKPDSIVNSWVYIYESCDDSLTPSQYDFKIDIKPDSTFDVELKTGSCEVSYNGTYQLNQSNIKFTVDQNTFVQSSGCNNSQTVSTVVSSNYSFQYGHLYLDHAQYSCNKAASVFKKGS